MFGGPRCEFQSDFQFSLLLLRGTHTKTKSPGKEISGLGGESKETVHVYIVPGFVISEMPKEKGRKIDISEAI